ncbi:hypothetical protein CU102_26415 [Phyllobacterium brassicacearum]|uniref:Uncharacterized protein n=1 Tax=Phyllobacterium brassicacearum TaxID=314235 RepID=A0A2P7B5J7_9HYPH|nr:hypothetical protein [Phyllobacterium brassicacearum]PSH61719.1 hypothetical protein CU102_26415 [Phyllobacterium brassicacearum]TDQ15327.1 hypothetical protein DEV91_13440 [Phyllobacterium brassicacearum]
MKDNPSTKIQIPQVRLSSTQMSSLIGEAIPSAEKKMEPAKVANTRPPPQEPPPVEDIITENHAEKSVRNRARTHRSHLLERLQIQLQPSVIAETKIRAVQDRTTASAIVEAALRAYLKL